MDKQPAEIRYPIPSREEHFDFLVRCYFGEGRDLLRLCIHRAYLDFARTLHGFADHKGDDRLRQGGYDSVFELLVGLRKRKIRSQLEFDKWHEAACAQLQQQYRDGRFKDFSVGQAKKWLNMSLKYLFTVGEDRLPGFAHLSIRAYSDRQCFSRKCGCPRWAEPTCRLEPPQRLQRLSQMPTSIPRSVSQFNSVGRRI
jgi:hypothetical protein